MTSRSDLAYFGGQPSLPQTVKHPDWPFITPEYEKAVVGQMHESMSIYNRSGTIEEFEDIFAKLHGMHYALLSNSGTNTIWSMFVAAGLQPGDEVLCPTYTFFATNTPLLSIGAIPVFCDADEHGNISVRDMKHRLTLKTKAVVVTHMWGYPCDMDAISAFAKKHNLLLFEDCSHAHFAKINGKLVGTFGDAAAWSLQGQKNITGGEGGIMLTNNREIYIRANLHGHYNKRCKQEIPEDHELYRFATTGMGLKMRSHPLAIAFAKLQVDKYPEYQAMRNYCAVEYEKLFKDYGFIEPLSHANSEPSWYGFIFKYNPAMTKVNREQFVEMLQAEGLSEVDIPGSTAPNHSFPIFQEPSVLFPYFYKPGESFNTKESFPGAKVFYSSIIKLPVWTQEAHKDILGRYLDGLKKVLDYAAGNE